MADTLQRYTLRNRYVFTGRLVMQTAFHIGGGRNTLSSSDSPVVLTPEGYPFIPGSSFKGALRSTVEKIIPGLPEDAGLFTCALEEFNEQELDEIRKQPDAHICPTSRQREIAQLRRNNIQFNEEDTIYTQLCHTCQLFGSPFAAARMSINDLYMYNKEWSLIQQRDGVAIDRDSEKARDRLKYDFEVVPASTAFDLKIILENASNEDLQLISIGLSEFVNGFGFIGGKRSRGLGACELTNLQVEELDLTISSKEGQTAEDLAEKKKERNNRLKSFLLRHTFSNTIEGQTFLDSHIEALFSKENNA